MNISDLLAPEAVMPALKVQNKKQLLQELAARAALQTRLPEKRILETLIERERLGTTGVGQGIAIPHGRMAGVTNITGVFARLESGIDYEAVDSQPVDLVFMLLAPENAGADHLKALARVSRLLRNQTACEKLRTASTAEALYAVLRTEVRRRRRPDSHFFFLTAGALLSVPGTMVTFAITTGTSGAWPSIGPMPPVFTWLMASTTPGPPITLPNTA
jgi:PTS system nitrogen regulatory IIA component